MLIDMVQRLHDARTACITNMGNAGVDEKAKRFITGHTTKKDSHSDYDKSKPTLEVMYVEMLKMYEYLIGLDVAVSA